MQPNNPIHRLRSGDRKSDSNITIDSDRDKHNDMDRNSINPQHFLTTTTTLTWHQSTATAGAAASATAAAAAAAAAAATPTFLAMLVGVAMLGAHSKGCSPFAIRMLNVKPDDVDRKVSIIESV
jgi:hypothetical protein